jgi:hypothetical protein
MSKPKNEHHNPNMDNDNMKCFKHSFFLTFITIPLGFVALGIYLIRRGAVEANAGLLIFGIIWTLFNALFTVVGCAAAGWVTSLWKKIKKVPTTFRHTQPRRSARTAAATTTTTTAATAGAAPATTNIVNITMINYNNMEAVEAAVEAIAVEGNSYGDDSIQSRHICK